MKIIKTLRDFTVECLFFMNPMEGTPIPNFALGVVAWWNIYVIAVAIAKQYINQ